MRKKANFSCQQTARQTVFRRRTARRRTVEVARGPVPVLRSADVTAPLGDHEAPLLAILDWLVDHPPALLPPPATPGAPLPPPPPDSACPGMRRDPHRAMV